MYSSVHFSNLVFSQENYKGNFLCESTNEDLGA